MADFTETAGEPERKTCEVEHDGQVCPREFSVNATVDGVEYACCSAHYERAKKLNKSGTEFTKPIGLCALIDACEVTHEGRACGKSTFAWLTVEAQRLCCCAAHYHRHWAAGKTDADFTKPIRVSLPDHCQVEHQGTPCGRKAQKFGIVEGVEYGCCNGHYRRARKKRTGVAFTKPVRTQARRQPLRS